MYRNTLILFALVLFTMAITTSVQAVIWTDNGTDHLWSNGDNWDGGVAPGGGVDAEIWQETVSLTKYTYGPAGGVGPTVDSSVYFAKLKFRNGDINVVSGGSLISANYIEIGFWQPDSGGVPPFIGSGRMTVTGNGHVEGPYVWIGDSTDGILTMKDDATVDTAGSVYVGGPAPDQTADGHIQLDGGTLTCNNIIIKPGSTIDVNGGTIIVTNTFADETAWQAWQGKLLGYSSSGSIYTSDARGSVVMDYNFVPETLVGVTTVNAISPRLATVNHWPLDETTSGSVADVVAGDDGVNWGAAIDQPGMIGKSYYFDGTAYLEVPGANMVFTGPITVEAWVKFADVNGQQAIFTKADVIYCGQSCGGFELGKLADGAIGFKFSDGILSTGNSGNWDAVNTVRSNWNAGRWYHIAATWDGTTDPNSMKIYVNGILDNQSQAEQNYIENNDLDFVIGALKPSEGDNIAFFNGFIDEPRIYSIELTPEEIAENARVPFNIELNDPIVFHGLIISLETIKDLTGKRIEISISKAGQNVVEYVVDDAQNGAIYTYQPVLRPGINYFQVILIDKVTEEIEYEYVADLEMEKVDELNLMYYSWRLRYQDINSAIVDAVSDSPIDIYSPELIGSYLPVDIPDYNDFLPYINIAKTSSKQFWPRLYRNVLSQCDDPEKQCYNITEVDIYNEAGVLEEYYSLIDLALRIARETNAGGIVIDPEDYSTLSGYGISSLAEAKNKTEQQIIDRCLEIGAEIADIINNQYPEAVIWYLFIRTMNTTDSYIAQGLLARARDMNYQFTVIEGGEHNVWYPHVSLKDTRNKLNHQYEDFINDGDGNLLDLYPNLRLGGCIAPWKDYSQDVPVGDNFYNSIEQYKASGGTHTTLTIDDFGDVFSHLFNARGYTWIYGVTRLSNAYNDFDPYLVNRVTDTAACYRNALAPCVNKAECDNGICAYVVGGFTNEQGYTNNNTINDVVHIPGHISFSVSGLENESIIIDMNEPQPDDFSVFIDGQLIAKWYCGQINLYAGHSVNYSDTTKMLVLDQIPLNSARLVEVHYNQCFMTNIDGQGLVNLKDFALMARDWNETETGVPLDGDIDKSGQVNMKDLAVMAWYWLSNCD